MGADAMAREDCEREGTSEFSEGPDMASGDHSETYDGADGCLEIRLGEKEKCVHEVGDAAERARHRREVAGEGRRRSRS